ncbi:MAG: sterol desaturase family protein [Cyanobacteria bacterium J06560_5]
MKNNNYRNLSSKWLVRSLLILVIAATLILYADHILKAVDPSGLFLENIREGIRQIPAIQIIRKACRQVLREVLLSPTFYLLTLGILILEWWKPGNRKQKLLSPGLGQDLLWLIGSFFIAGLLLVPFTALLRSGYGHFLRPLSINLPGQLQLPPVVTMIVAILAVDFLSWYAHWLQHHNRFLWRFHAVHHSQAEMNLFTDARFHFGDALIAYPLQILPLYLLLIPFPHGIYYVFFRIWYPRFYHANIKMNLGPLKYIFVTPQSHRVHHSTDRKHWDKNFGVIFSFWDYLFRTQYRGYQEYPSTGIDDPNFPVETHLSFRELPKNYLKQLLHPFHIRQRQSST